MNSTASSFQVKIKVIEAHGLSKKDKKTQSDPYVIAKFKGMKNMATSVQTSIINNNPNPVWNQELCLFPKSVNDVLLLKVYDSDHHKKDNLLGMVEIPLERFFQTGAQDSWFQLMKRKGAWKSLVGKAPFWFSVPGSLHIQLWFGNGSSSMLSQGMAPQYNTGVNNTGMNTTGMNNTGMNNTGMNTTGMNTGMNSGMNNTGMNTGFNNTGVNSGIATTGLNNNGLNNTGLNNSGVKEILITDIESPEYNSETWTSKDYDSGFNAVNPQKFNWYQNKPTTTI